MVDTQRDSVDGAYAQRPSGRTSAAFSVRNQLSCSAVAGIGLCPVRSHQRVKIVQSPIWAARVFSEVAFSRSRRIAVATVSGTAGPSGRGRSGLVTAC